MAKKKKTGGGKRKSTKKKAGRRTGAMSGKKAKSKKKGALKKLTSVLRRALGSKKKAAPKKKKKATKKAVARTSRARGGAAKPRAAKKAAKSMAKRGTSRGSAPKGGPRNAGKMSDEAVHRATGKSWNEWFQLLDSDKAMTLPHAEIAKLLHEKHGAGDWWSQMVTVEYEQARGLREKHQTADGYEVSASKTLNVPVDTAFRAWDDADERRKWLADPNITVTTSTAPKSMRALWTDGVTRVSVNFYPKGDDKSQVTVQHLKLADGNAAAKMKQYWFEQLERLQADLEEARSAEPELSPDEMELLDAAIDESMDAREASASAASTSESESVPRM